MDPSDLRSFGRVMATFAGERYPLDAGASKVMHFMCWDHSGCDAVITASTFEINFGWNYGPHRYFLRTAPGIVSWLVAASGTRGERELQFPIGPTEIGPTGGFSPWQMPALQVAMWAERDQLTIRMRDTVAALASPLPPPVPPHLQYRAVGQPCRHCGQTPDRYRVLRDGSFVCLACGRSQPPFD